MLFRLLIFAILAAVIYRAIKSKMGGSEQSVGRPTDQAPKPVDDVMIKDPVCGTYFPERDAVALRLDNRNVHFCSTECRDRYLDQQSQRPAR